MAKTLALAVAQHMVGQQMHRDVRPQRRGKGPDGGHIFRAVVAPRDGGDPQNQRPSQVIVDVPDVRKNAPIRHTRQTPMHRAVHVLDIQQRQIHMWKYAVNDRPLGIAAALDRGVDPGRLRPGQQALRKIRMRQRLAAGERHAAAGGVIENCVPLHSLQRGLRRHQVSRDLPGLRKTAGNAGTAVRTDIAVRHGHGSAAAPLKRNGPPRACRGAFSAAGTLLFIGHQLGPCALRLGIGAPDTSQRAPLDKDGAPDPRPVVNAVGLNVEHHGRCLHGIMLLHLISSRCPRLPGAEYAHTERWPAAHLSVW